MPLLDIGAGQPVNTLTEEELQKQQEANKLGGELAKEMSALSTSYDGLDGRRKERLKAEGTNITEVLQSATPKGLFENNEVPTEEDKRKLNEAVRGVKHIHLIVKRELKSQRLSRENES